MAASWSGWNFFISASPAGMYVIPSPATPRALSPRPLLFEFLAGNVGEIFFS